MVEHGITAELAAAALGEARWRTWLWNAARLQSSRQLSERHGVHSLTFVSSPPKTFFFVSLFFQSSSNLLPTGYRSHPSYIAEARPMTIRQASSGADLHLAYGILRARFFLADSKLRRCLALPFCYARLTNAVHICLEFLFLIPSLFTLWRNIIPVSSSGICSQVKSKVRKV